MDHEKSIFLKYLDGKAGLDEKQQLLSALKNNPEARQELQSTYALWAEKNGAVFDPYASLNGVLEKVSRKRPFLIPALAAVAAVMVAVVMVWNPLQRKQIQTTPAMEAGLYTLPESDSPLVLLSDGQVINSEAVEMQVSCSAGSVRIDGQEYYSSSSTKTQCMVSVPYGRRARVQFADGTTVRMNSHSRLVFPVSFGKERTVKMTGEALFDVSRDESRPFVVSIDDVRVQVLGTRFLVSKQDDDAHRVALISGSVNVSLADSKTQSVTLAPNQLCTLDDNGKVIVEDVDDFSSMIGWSEGVYYARNTSMKDLLQYLSRYYGARIDYAPEVAGLSCTGTLKLKDKLSDMLSDLSRSLPLASRMEDDVWVVNLSKN